MTEIPEGFKLDDAVPPGFKVIGQTEPGDKSSLFDDISTGLDVLSKEVPLAEAAEFAAGFNRFALGMIDSLGVDTANSLLTLGGSKKRIPKLTESIPGTQGGFVEPGLKKDILGGAGETAAAALAIGQAVRSLAKQLPAAVGSESVSTGLLRQAGQTTAAADVGFGATAGAGQELGQAAGEAVGGEPGRIVGGTIGGVAAPLAVIPLVSAKNTASSLLKKAAPSVDKLKSTASAIYNSLDDAGVRIPEKTFAKLANTITNTLKKEGADINLTPETNAVIKRLATEVGSDKTLTEIDTLRKVAQGAAQSTNANERRLGTIAVNKLDDFLDNLGSDVVGGKKAGPAFRAARDLWHRAKKADLLDRAVLNAQDQASGFENGLRTQFRQILKRINTGRERGFTKEETAAIRRVVNGTSIGNVARFLGKFGVLDGVTSRSLTTVSGAGVAGAATGSVGVAASVPIVGQLSGALAQRMTLNNARMANAVIRAGKNGSLITKAYIKNTPKSQRTANELAELFIKNKVPVEQLSTNKLEPLMADAAIIAAVARINDTEEQ